MVEYVSHKDIYEIRLASLVTNVDKDVILELYQPLIGSQATILYLTLLKQKRNEDDEEIYETEKLLNLMQLSPSQLLNARHFLEAVGLIRSYEKRGEDCASYIYVLYSPKTPKDFFEDVLFKGLLIQYVGEKETKRLANKYKISLTIPEEYNEVSASFVDVYHPDYDSDSFRKEIKSTIVGHTHGRAKIEFNYDLFFSYITENSAILVDSFTKKDMKEIERYATLFGLNEKQIAFIVIDEFNPSSKPHLDFSSIATRCENEAKFSFVDRKPISKSSVSGDSIIAKKIKLMEDIDPVHFLSALQGGSKPAYADINIVKKLSEKYGFSNGVINVIIDTTLTRNNNILSMTYCDKIAASFARAKVNTVVDCMNYVNRIGQTKKVSNYKENTIKTIVDEKVVKVSDNKNSISDDEMNDILADIESLK